MKFVHAHTDDTRLPLTHELMPVGDTVIHEIANIGNGFRLACHRILEGQFLLSPHPVGDVLDHAQRLTDTPVFHCLGSTQFANPANCSVSTANAVLDGAVVAVGEVMFIFIFDAFPVFADDIGHVVIKAINVFHVKVDTIAVDPRATFTQVKITLLIFIVDEVTDIGNFFALARQFITIFEIAFVAYLARNVLHKSKAAGVDPVGIENGNRILTYMPDAVVLQQDPKLNLQRITLLHGTGRVHVVLTVLGMYHLHGLVQSTMRGQGFLDRHIEQVGVFLGTGFEPTAHATPLVVPDSGHALGRIVKGKATH